MQRLLSSTQWIVQIQPFNQVFKDAQIFITGVVDLCFASAFGQAHLFAGLYAGLIHYIFSDINGRIGADGQRNGVAGAAVDL